MAGTIEISLVSAAVLLLLSLLASKLSDRFGVPALLLFLGLGMLAGSDGPGGVHFDDPALAQFVAIFSLAFILFSGGTSTEWGAVRPVIRRGAVLACLGVAITAVVTGLLATALLRLPLLQGLLLGSIMSSTDAAAVFSILRAKGISLRGDLKSLLEVESGSNDPMAVLLTIGLVQVLTAPGSTWVYLVRLFVLQVAIGALAGYAMGRLMAAVVNRAHLGYDGLYPVLTMALVLLTYAGTSLAGGNGFLAVYLSGLVVGNSDFHLKRRVVRFHDGLSWLTQITMFLTLGLLVFPSRLWPVAGKGLLVAAGLMFVARPLAVFLCLLPSKMSTQEKAFVSWVGLRGAVPIVLAIYPLLAGLQQSELFFNIVFFVVLTSVLLQGTSLPYLARWLHVDAPLVARPCYPLHYSAIEGPVGDLHELRLPPGSPLVGQEIARLDLPADLLVVMVARRGRFIVPGGATRLEAGDHLLVLAENGVFRDLQARASAPVQATSST